MELKDKEHNKGKKFNLEHATKAHRRGIGIAILFL
jgi:hypothetical protein